MLPSYFIHMCVYAVCEVTGCESRSLLASDQEQLTRMSINYRVFPTTGAFRTVSVCIYPVSQQSLYASVP